MKTHLDLTSGIGGFALAARWAGYTTIGFCEIDPYCQRVLAHHWPGVPIHDDLTTLTAEIVRGWIAGDHVDQGRAVHNTDNGRGHKVRQVQPGRDGAGSSGEIRLLTAGYPCQPFSHAGRRLGAEDDRHLWPYISRLVADLRPRWCLFENVAGHISLGLDDVLADLEALGYACRPVVIPACAVNAPHRRDRVWIVANASGNLWGASRHDEHDASDRPSDFFQLVAHTSGATCETWDPIASADEQKRLP